MAIGKLNVILGADVSEFQSKMAGVNALAKQTAAGVKQQWEQIGKASLVMGAAITSAFTLMAKSAIDEDINVKRLTTTLRNVGIEYDNVKDSLESVISATQRKTGIADNEQRDILNRLLLVTNDYNKALSLLPTVLDLAAAGEMDATTAATYLGKAYLDLENGAKQVSVRFGQASLQFKNMEDIQNRVAGAAENLVNPLDVVKNSVSDLSEAIGSVFIPTIRSLVDKMATVIDAFKTWTEKHPTLTKVVVTLTATIGLLLLALGGWVFLAKNVIVHTMLLTAKLIAYKIVLIAATASQWAFNASLTATSALLAGLTAGIGMIVWGFTQLKSNADLARESQQKLLDLNREIAKAWKGEKSNAIEMLQATLDEVRAKHELGTATQNELKWLVEEEKHYESIIAQLKARQKAQEALSAVSDKTTDEMIDDLKTLNTEAKRRATESTNANIKAIDKWMDAEIESHNTKMSNLDKEYSAQLRNIDLQLGITLSVYQGQIDAINKLTADENLARTKADEKIRLLELQAAVDSAKTAEDKTAAIKELWEYQTEINRNELLRQRDDEIQALRDSMDVARQKADNEKTQAEIAYEANKTRLTNEYNDTITMLKNTKTSLDTALTEQLQRYDDDLLAYDENLRLKKLSYETFIKEYNAAIAALSKTPTPEVPSILFTPTLTMPSPLKTHAKGGILTEPTLLTSMRTMRPYGIAGEAGPEMITPLSQMITPLSQMGGGYKTANIIMQLDGRTLAQVLGQPLVDMIRLKTGAAI